MGIPGLLKEIGKGERIALSKLATEHLEKNRRPLRLAIDAAIWSFQNQAGQGGKNPALRTLFFRLLKLLALPIHPVFVYDGPNKPLTKRNKSVRHYGTCIPNEMSKRMIEAFRMPFHVAPGEAEAECAMLQQKGYVDAVMSQDVDTIMFGSSLTLRDWSKEAARGNKSATHVNAIYLDEVQMTAGLSPSGMILVALLSGGDYNTDGIPGFGPNLACEVARAGFGAELLELIERKDEAGLQEWRDRLNIELETNESGYFKTKHKATKIPDGFPDRIILEYYTHPAVSKEANLPSFAAKWSGMWEEEIDILALRRHVAETLDWQYRSGAKRFMRTFAPALLAHRLRQGLTTRTITSVENIKERRRHFINDGIPEIRVEITPADVVGLDLELEQDNPVDSEDVSEDDAESEAVNGENPILPQHGEVNHEEVRIRPGTKRIGSQWDPFATEKVWIPEAILRYGAPRLMQEWDQRECDLLTDPKKFAIRKCPKTRTVAKVKDDVMKSGALDSYLTTSKTVLQSFQVESIEANVRQPFSTMSDTNMLQASGNQNRFTVAAHKSPKLDVYFKFSKNGPTSLPGRLPLTTSKTEASTSIYLPILSKREVMPRPEGVSLPTTSKYLSQSSLQLLGASIETPITLSPTPEESQKQNEKYLRRVDASENEQRLQQTRIDSSVTNVMRKRGRPVETDRGTDLAISESKPPVASFFVPKKRYAITSPLETPGGSSFVPSEPSTGLSSKFPTMKAIAVPRDSLPGAWKEIASTTIIVTSKAEDGPTKDPMINCVDLTGED